MGKIKRMISVIRFPAAVLRPLREYLVSQQKRLERRRTTLIQEDPFSDTERVNENAASDTDAAEISGHDRIEALRGEVDRRIITVRKALTRIRLGRYGLCENCGSMIDTDRLSVNPTAELCIRCARRKT